MLNRILILLFAFSGGARATPPASPNLAVQDCVNLYGNLISSRKVPGVGSSVYLLAERSGLRDFNQINELKIGQFNPENLYNYSEKFIIDPETGKKVITRPAMPKPELRWKINRELMERTDNDIMLWEEVDDLEAATNFVDQELGGRYRVILIQGSKGPEKNMEVAILVKKDLPFDLEVQSHKDVTYYNRRRKVRENLQSRDVLVARFRRAGTNRNSPPLFTIQGGHYRSMRPRTDDPVRSIKKRTLQYHHTLQIKKAEEEKFPNTPIFLLADFNSNLRNSANSPRSVEAKMLFDPRRGGFTDSLDLAPKKIPPEERITHTFHPENGPTSYTQLDGILVNQVGVDLGLVKEAHIVPFKDANGRELPVAHSQKERNRQGSDHRMVQTVIDFKKIRDSSR